MTAGTVDITLALPRSLVSKLEQAARVRHTSVADVVADAVDHLLPAAEDLPAELFAELLAMVDLSDAALQEAALARLTDADDERLRRLVSSAEARPLTTAENAEREALVARWQESVVKRAQALMLLKRRGLPLPQSDDNGSTGGP